jgi:hypothetical protein
VNVAIEEVLDGTTPAPRVVFSLPWAAGSASRALDAAATA